MVFFIFTDSFERAKEKLSMAENQSDLNTDTEEKMSRHKRAKKGGDFYSCPPPSTSGSSEEEDVYNSISNIRDYPKPPKQRKEENTPVMTTRVESTGSYDTPSTSKKTGNHRCILSRVKCYLLFIMISYLNTLQHV